MRKLAIITIILFALISCKDNKKIIQEAKKMHQDSAKIDSILFQNLKQKDEKLNGVLINSPFYNVHQLDSIFAGKK